MQGRSPGQSCRLLPDVTIYGLRGAVRKEIYISNTSSEVECPSKIKTIGLHMYGLDGITVEGMALL